MRKEKRKREGTKKKKKTRHWMYNAWFDEFHKICEVR